jgi:hypothetical protein
LAIGTAVAVAPVRTWVLLTGALAVAWALWATCPPGAGIGRHLAAQAGRVVLDAVHAVVRTVITVVVVIALVAVGWSAITPRLTAAVDRATDTVTSHTHTGLLSRLGRVREAWEHVTKETTR